jgi:hypothetical protein
LVTQGSDDICGMDLKSIGPRVEGRGREFTVRCGLASGGGVFRYVLTQRKLVSYINKI